MKTEVVNNELLTVRVSNLARVKGVLQGHKVQLVLVGVGSAAAGAAVSFVVVRRVLKTKYEALAEEEIQQAKRYYGDLHDKAKSPAEVIKDRLAEAETKEVLEKVEDAIEDSVVERLKNYGAGSGTIQAPEGMTEVVSNVFTDVQNDRVFDYVAEMQNRNPDEPYIITHDEFVEDGPEFTQSTITYYAGDDNLADENDKLIPDVEATVGEDNLTKFGHGSKDMRTVYVRNEKLEMDFEIVLSDGKFTEEVLGFIEHSDQRPRRFRRDEE